MYISKQDISNGYNEYIALDSPNGRLAMMDVGLLVLEAGENYCFDESDKEIAILLLEGSATYKWNNHCVQADRENVFDYKAWCLHAPHGIKCKITALKHSEFYIQKTLNDKVFEPKLYKPEDTHVQRAGANGELNGAMRRNILTIFDYSNAPHSNMVLGEVINFPGCWSSYPPHHHPQPEVYFYRYDKPQGFGVGFTNGNIYETHHNGLLIITDKFHSQAAAPGYALYYAWGIRHLDGNPWKKTRIDDIEHTWMLEDNPDIWHEKV
jgi:5-deoxy-glucuronate isomerase